MSDKPKFDPSQPFAPAESEGKPAFNPNSAFTEAPKSDDALDLIRSLPPEERTPVDDPGLGKTFGYPYGILKTGLASLASKIAGGNPLSAQTIKDASAGNAPSLNALVKETAPVAGKDITRSASDYFPGLFPGGKYLPEKGGRLDAAPLNVAEVALASKLDPMNGFLNGVMRPVSASGSKMGENIYRSALREGDAMAKLNKVKIPPSETGWLAKVPNLEELRTSGEAVLENARKPIYKRINDAGLLATKEGLEENMVPARQMVKRLRDSGVPGNKVIADALEESINEHVESLAGKPVESISEAKTAEYGKQGENSHNVLNRPGKGKQASKSLSLSLKNYTEKMAEDAIPTTEQKVAESLIPETEIIPGGKAQLADINQRAGGLLSARKVYNKDFMKELRKNAATQVDPAFGMGGAGVGATIAPILHGNPGIGAMLGVLGGIGLKKGIKYVNNPNNRMGIGLGLEKLTNPSIPYISPSIWDEMLRREIIKKDTEKQ